MPCNCLQPCDLSTALSGRQLVERQRVSLSGSEARVAVLPRKDRRPTRLESDDWPVYAVVTDPPSSPPMTIASIPAQLMNCKTASSSIHAVHSGDTDSQDLVALHYRSAGARRRRGVAVCFPLIETRCVAVRCPRFPPSTRVCSCRRRRCLCRPPRACGLSLAILPFITQKRNATRDESELEFDFTPPPCPCESNAGIPVCQAINPFHDLEVIHHTYPLPSFTTSRSKRVLVDDLDIFSSQQPFPLPSGSRSRCKKRVALFSRPIHRRLFFQTLLFSLWEKRHITPPSRDSSSFTNPISLSL
jgi:hypothetical protein